MRTAEENIFSFGRFQLDNANKVLRYDGEIVALPRKAVELLCLLIENDGEVVSKQEIFDKIWADSFVEESVLTQNIYTLRKTFETYGEKKPIKTVPRRGYIFNYKNETETALVIEREIYEEIEIVETENSHESVLALLPVPNQTNYWKIFFGAAAILIIAAGGFLSFLRHLQSVPTVTLANVRSIAILPLKSFDGQAEDETLQMRITDALITRLGGSDKIAVRSTNAVLPFAATNTDALEVGRKLQTDAILDGRIQQENERIRVTLQLINVADGKQIWAQQFDGRSNEILNLQDAIAAKVLETLNINRSQKIELTARPTENAEAYEAYLRGRYHWNKRSPDGFAQAVVFFEKAIALDPKFAEAFSGLSDAHLGFYDYGIKPADKCIPQAKTAVNQSLQLKPNSAEAHSTLSAIQYLYDRNRTEAEDSIKKAIEINPQYGTAHLRYGWFLTMAGRFDEAERELAVALEQDPTSAIVQTNIGYLLFCKGETDEAERRFYQVLKANPQFSLPYWYLGAIKFQRGERSAMFEKYLKAFELDTDKNLPSKIREILQSKGETAALKLWRENLEETAQTSYLPPTNIALIAAIQQDKTAALDWLEKAETQKDPWLLQIKYDREYDFLRNEPRFQEVVRKMSF